MTYDVTVDYYAVLGLTSTASLPDIRKAYHQLCRKFHPDRKAQANDTVLSAAERTVKTQELNQAYEIIGDSEVRTSYDRHRELYLARKSNPNPPPPPPPPPRPPPPPPQWDYYSSNTSSSSSEDEHKDHEDHKDQEHEHEHEWDTWSKSMQSEAERFCYHAETLYSEQKRLQAIYDEFLKNNGRFHSSDPNLKRKRAVDYSSESTESSDHRKSAEGGQSYFFEDNVNSDDNESGFGNNSTGLRTAIKKRKHEHDGYEADSGGCEDDEAEGDGGGDDSGGDGDGDGDGGGGDDEAEEWESDDEAEGEYAKGPSDTPELLKERIQNIFLKGINNNKKKTQEMIANDLIATVKLNNVNPLDFEDSMYYKAIRDAYCINMPNITSSRGSWKWYSKPFDIEMKITKEYVAEAKKQMDINKNCPRLFEKYKKQSIAVRSKRTIIARYMKIIKEGLNKSSGGGGGGGGSKKLKKIHLYALIFEEYIKVQTNQ